MTTLSTMDTKAFFYSTLHVSVIVQIITGIVEIITLFFAQNAPPQYYLINHLVYLELTVQIIEGLFYIWLVYNFNKVTNVTPKRYIDWAITTPTMLITLMVYLIYLGNKNNNIDTTGMTLFGTLKDNMDTVSKIITLNWLMLLFGYMGEVKILSTVSGVLMGFIPFSYFGKISYGIYVYQGLFLLTGPGSELKFQQFPLNFILTLGLAVVSYHFLEKPIMRFKNRF